jgi:hypothetical protein
MQNLLLLNIVLIMLEWVLFRRFKLCSGLLFNLHLWQYHFKLVLNMPKPMLDLPDSQLNLCKMQELHGRVPVHTGKMCLQLSDRPL